MVGSTDVCDVNGWSFVKQSRSYFEDCAELLYRLVVARCMRPASRVSSPNVLSTTPPRAQPREIKGPANSTDNMGELVCVIAIVRHGERTPKQKSKYISTRQEWLDIYNAYVSGKWRCTGDTAFPHANEVLLLRLAGTH
jgi:inositol hexakisphosphate/diphosphoinositol-pentakisphosphate kinase